MGSLAPRRGSSGWTALRRWGQKTGVQRPALRTPGGMRGRLELHDRLDSPERRGVGRVVRVVVIRELGANEEVVVEVVARAHGVLGETLAHADDVIVHLLAADAEGSGPLARIEAGKRQPVVAL